jgi:hypothetical protein
MILVLVSAPFKHVSQRQRAFTILAQRTSASHDEKPQFTERTPECRHGSNAVDFNVCEIDCIERIIQTNNIGGHVKVSKTLAPILFPSLLDGLKLFQFLALWRHNAHWSWNAPASTETVLYVLYLCTVVLAIFGMAVLHGNFPESNDLKVSGRYCC